MKKGNQHDQLVIFTIASLFPVSKLLLQLMMMMMVIMMKETPSWGFKCYRLVFICPSDVA